MISDSSAPSLLRLLPPRAEMVRAYQASDASYDGLFFTAVRTTGVFCRPSCRPPRPPRPDHVEFFATLREAVTAGYRPCKLCAPQSTEGRPPEWVARLMERIDREGDGRFRATDLRELGVSPERVRRWFQENHGVTFTAWLRGRRLAQAFTQIRNGTDLDDVALGNGFESHSGFREAFAKVFGTPPGQAAQGRCVFVALLESPIGRLLAGATDAGICRLEFVDRSTLPDIQRQMQEQLECPVLPGPHRWLDQLSEELQGYFAGQRRQFYVPIAPVGTPFQRQVWEALAAIPFGQTESYQALATRLGRPTAMRAVARANGDNRICLLIPCHRVIGKDGTLTGYGGGLWRKRLLLELEQNGCWPGN